MTAYSGFEEVEIIRLVAQSNEEAFRELFERYQPQVYNFACSHMRSEVLAEEITQEIFIKVWDLRGSLPEVQVFKGWLRTVVRNLSYSYLRRIQTERKVLDYLSGGVIQSEADVSGELIARDLAKTIQKVLEQLSPRQRTIFEMSRTENMRYADIAAKLNMSENTVHYHIKYILARFRSALGPDIFILVLLVSNNL